MMEDGDLRQRVESEIKVTVPVRELKESALQEKLGDWGKVPFDLGEAPLIRMELWQTESRQILAIDTHHVIMDGMSLWPFSQALSQAYQGVGPNISSDKNALSYIDYVCWQQSEAQQVLRAKQAAFWNSMFADGIPALELPTDFREPAERSFQGGTHSFFLDGPLFEQVQQFCKQTGITPFMLLYSAFTLLISKFSQKEDLVIATTSSGRNLPETEDMVGMFVNTLAIRNTVDSGLPFIRFLERTKQMLLESFENDAFPYDELISGLRARQFGDNAAQVMFTMLKEGEELLAFGQNKLEILRFSEETPAKFDLTFSGSENSTSIGFDIVYSAELFSRESISMLAERFVNLLRHALSAPEKAVSKLPILLDQEAEKIQSWNSNTVDVPKSALVHQLFEQKAIEFPGHTALIFEEEELTYEELNKKANRLAHCLRERGVRAESKVGICLERSSELIISILAVWKSGGAYVPLDPSYPTDRLAFMIGDSGMELILTQESLLPLMEKVCLNTAVVPVAKEELEQVLAGYEDSNPLLESQADNLAYIIYTSGTTGRPKGAMIEHRNAVNLAYAQHQTLTVKPTDRILQFASISFDASAFEILLALTAGAALVMASKENLMPGTPLKDVLNQNRVTVAVLTPVALYHLDTDHIPSLRKVLSAGEVLPLTTARKWSQTKILFNAYGPTEITVCATMKPINKEDKQITIGKPIPNYKTYILDSHGNQLPVGIPGELCIGGAGVGRGYLNRPELTAEKFVVDPFNPGGKMYRSGDLVRWLSNGEIEYLGRIDQQVKIRGFRIELGEIESALLSASDIREAAVTVRQDHLGEKYLCGYYAADGEKTVEELRGFLGQTLPEFMIPARFVALERLPIGPTGKIDRKALPDPGDSVSTGSEFVAPATEPEKSIARLWAQLLGLNPDSIGTRDNFFALGGDSLRAAQLSGRISQETETAVSVKDIFSNPTIAGLSELIAKRERTALSVIAKAPVQESYPLASAQKRVYLHSLQQGEGSVLYNMPAVYEVGGRLDLVRLNKAFQQVVDHFAAFRTSFLMEDGDLRQRVESEIKVTVPVRELKESALQEKLGDWGKEPFNLNKAPLIRLELWQTESRQFLAINTHHIIMDGMSYGPFFDALSKAYAGEVLTAKSVQYIDYAVWQTSAEQQAIIAQQGTYWQRIYAQDVPVLELPYDFPMPANRTYAGGMFLFELEPKTVEGIKYLAAQTGTTPFMVLYSVFALLVGKYAGQTAVVVGTTSSGRNIPQLEDMLGMLVNTLAIRTELQGNLTFNAYLEANKKVLLESFENDSYPYEDLVTDLRQNGNSKIPVRTMFTMMPKGAEEISVDSNVLSAVDVDGVALSKFDLTFNGVEGAESIDFLITYPSELFHSDTISLMAARFEQLLQQAVQKPDSLLQELSIRVEKEKELVSGWNDTYRDFPTSQTLSELFESTVRLYPENTALVYKDLEINYEELERKANQLACVLIDQGIKTGDLVGLLLTKSPDLVVSILAIWKAGGAYVPLDPSYPTDRLHYMLEDAGVSLLLTHEVAQTAAIKASEGLPILMFVYEDLESDLYKPSTDKLPCAASPIDLAYVIYTSGSTGKPKGVMIEHRTAVNLAFAFKESMGTIAEPRILQFASISFDASVTDLLMAFANGGTLVIADRENLMPGPALTETLNRYQISHIKLTPTALGYLSPDDLPYLYTVYAGGEALTLELARRWASKKRLINAYGPTEATVNTTLRHIEGDEKRVTLGRPLANYQIQILDQSGNVLPVGMPGELCIGGDGLARGYLNRPELTAEKFISDPIRTGGRLYRSGDLARWLSNGEIEFLGRIDHQVKIRGFRIECGEIESALLGINGVSAAAVVARTDAKDEKYLCAYFVANEEKTINELRGLLSRTLPEFMVPARFVQLDKLPLTGSGKTDRKALPAPGEDFKTGKVFIAPNTQQEKIMIEVWAATLGIRPDVISMEDDFFALGGNSLKAVVLIAKIHQRLEVQIPVQMIFQNSTPKSLIDHFEKVESNDDQFDAHLIPLQPTGSKTPLFIVPGIEGKCYYLIELAKSLGEDQPVYGFQSVGLLPGEQPFETVEEIAAYNIGLMKKVQTQGPYLLAGHSMGGWMAMEMANQLLRQGEKVAFLGLLDSYSPKVLADLGGFQIHSKERDINDLLMLVERLAEFFATNLDYHELKEKLDQLDHQGRLSLVLQWTVSNGLVPNAFSQEELWQWARLIGTNSRISFKPTKTGQITHLFKAEINGRENLNIADCLGWSATLPNLKIQETPGNHISMLHHPHLNSLANAIKECIQKAEVKHEQIIKKDSMDEQKRVLEIQNSKF
ncbi:amino acid adenylation domain-containing protein [Algoriphagus alkaliphilus]|uniref:amino acid adenylation domain-containing protein n=1 Tax=Algoriphagus alkaliphilus TaxID=279824 RepID=UPI0021CD750E|nr:non-ribosomal peptide synthetase [Algoriphagus alkaliphilus]